MGSFQQGSSLSSPDFVQHVPKSDPAYCHILLRGAPTIPASAKAVCRAIRTSLTPLKTSLSLWGSVLRNCNFLNYSRYEKKGLNLWALALALRHPDRVQTLIEWLRGPGLPGVLGPQSRHTVTTRHKTMERPSVCRSNRNRRENSMGSSQNVDLKCRAKVIVFSR